MIWYFNSKNFGYKHNFLLCSSSRFLRAYNLLGLTFLDEKLAIQIYQDTTNLFRAVKLRYRNFSVRPSQRNFFVWSSQANKMFSLVKPRQSKPTNFSPGKSKLSQANDLFSFGQVKPDKYLWLAEVWDTLAIMRTFLWLVNNKCQKCFAYTPSRMRDTR